MSHGKLFLIPTSIADGVLSVIPAQTRDDIVGLKHFLAEDIRTARRYLSSLKLFASIEALHFEELNKDTALTSISDLCEPLLKGIDIGILSESGCPGIADPGAIAVRWAHENHIQVIPLVGPSSIFLALMASGLNGQSFAFNGYLPIHQNELRQSLKEFEKESLKCNRTQIFIETPYRNNGLIKAMLNILKPETRLCIAQNITAKDEKIRTQSVKAWKLESIDIPKVPAVFMFLA